MWSARSAFVARSMDGLHELKLTGCAALCYMPYLAFVQKYGLDDCEAVIRLQAELTKRFAAEFSIG